MNIPLARMHALRALLCGIALLLGGCSATRLAYDHLDTLMRWQASDYVDLTSAQRRDFNVELYELWAWHRATQLPLYAADLKVLAGQVQAGPLSLQQVEQADQRAIEHWNNLIERAAPGYARLHAVLSDTQVSDMLARIGKQVDRKARKRLQQTPAQRRQRNLDEMNELLRHWIGHPSEQQRQLVEQWAACVAVDDAHVQRQEQQRKDRLLRYAGLLATRNQPGFEERVRAFIFSPQGVGEDEEIAQQERWLRLLAELSATLAAAQREHLRQHLLDYATEFDALAEEKPARDPDAPES
jgi:hypothetical protein